MVVKLRVSLSGVVRGSLAGSGRGVLLPANRELSEVIWTLFLAVRNREATAEKLAVTD